MSELTPVQMEILRQAREKRNAKGQAEAEKTRSMMINDPRPVDESVDGLETRDAGRKIGALDILRAGASAYGDVIGKRAESSTPEVMRERVRKSLQAADDLARVTAGPLGNALAAAVTDRSMQDEANDTNAAKERLAKESGSPMLPGVAGAVGQIGQAMALPAGALATPIRATMTGGAVGLLDGIWDRMSEGKPLTNMDAAGDMIGDSLAGAGSGFAGFHLGKHMNNFLGKLLKQNPDTATSREAMRISKINKRIVDESSKAMEDSGVLIKPDSIARLNFRIRTKLAKEMPADKSLWRNGFKATNILGAEVGRGNPLTLTQFNNLRRNINDSVRKASTGELKDTITRQDMAAIRMIKEEMNQFITELPARPKAVLAGDTASGVAAWKRMNEFYQKQARGDIVADTIEAAERETRSGMLSIDESLRKHFFSLIDSKAGQEALERERFTPAQRKALEKLAYGDFSSQTLNTLDKMTGGSGILTFMVNVVKKGQSAGFEADAAKLAARQAMAQAAEQSMQMQMAGPMGAAAGMAGQSMGMGVADPSAVPTMQPPPEGSGGGPMRPPRALRPVGGMNADPQFGTVPGLQGTKTPGGAGPL